MPRSFVTSTQAAPSNCRYSAAWSSTLERSALLSSRSRNCGTSALTPLMPMNVAVRPDRNAWTPRRTPARARRIDWSAVRSACTVVRPSVTPSTAAIDSVAATKIFAPRPSRAGLVALESLIRGVVLAVLVLVRHPAEAARVQLHVDSHGARRRDPHLARHLHEGHHARVDVAEHAHQPGVRERPSPDLPPPVLRQVELVRVARGEH